MADEQNKDRFQLTAPDIFFWFTLSLCLFLGRFIMYTAKMKVNFFLHNFEDIRK